MKCFKMRAFRHFEGGEVILMLYLCCAYHYKTCQINKLIFLASFCLPSCYLSCSLSSLSEDHTAKWGNSSFRVDVPSASSEVNKGDALLMRSLVL